MRPRYVFLVSLFAALACGKTQETAQVGSGESACDDGPVPAHECVGGVPKPRCNVVDGAPRWQIDCVPRDPNAPPDMRGLSPCSPAQCGAEPAWDARDCVYGFAGSSASCESLDRAACAWTRRCLPKPCSLEEGTCSVVDQEKVGPPCSKTGRCPEGYGCATIGADIGVVREPTCIRGPLCDAITCAAGKTCRVTLSEPAGVGCHNR